MKELNRFPWFYQGLFCFVLFFNDFDHFPTFATLFCIRKSFSFIFSFVFLFLTKHVICTKTVPQNITIFVFLICFKDWFIFNNKKRVIWYLLLYTTALLQFPSFHSSLCTTPTLLSSPTCISMSTKMSRLPRDIKWTQHKKLHSD